MADTAEYIRTLEDELRDAMLMMEHPDAEQRVRASRVVEALTTAIDCMEREQKRQWLEERGIGVRQAHGRWWIVEGDASVGDLRTALISLTCAHPNGWPAPEAAVDAAYEALKRVEQEEVQSGCRAVARWQVGYTMRVFGTIEVYANTEEEAARQVEAGISPSDLVYAADDAEVEVDWVDPTEEARKDA